MENGRMRLKLTIKGENVGFDLLVLTDKREKSGT
jgi:hypothetical protein